MRIEEISIVKWERYAESPESLECFERAVNDGIGAIFYTWSIDAEDSDIDPSIPNPLDSNS